MVVAGIFHAEIVDIKLTNRNTPNSQNGASLALGHLYMTCFQVKGCTLVMWYDDNSHIIHVNKLLSHSIHNSHVSSLPLPSLSPFHGKSLGLMLCSSR